MSGEIEPDDIEKKEKWKASCSDMEFFYQEFRSRTEVKEAIRYIIESQNKSKINQNTNDDQKAFMIVYLYQEKKAKIELSLLILFVVDFLGTLKTLSGSLLDDEIFCVNTKVYQLLKKEKNLTLSIDG
ncbi:hypothetical protein RCL_jg7089.t1 [Rhizophagus clarus]|uniref:Uncharacterized protein n=1 Tax=Rhizophagus clarus TaxID=94130 RepID=A0A8H3M1N2_9GLOM|nr:hypothetical protein RCL_jg7089.t1 [Rhizophagus clarus]